MKLTIIKKRLMKSLEIKISKDCYAKNTYSKEQRGKDIQIYVGIHEFRIFDEKSSTPTFCLHLKSAEQTRNVADAFDDLFKMVDFKN